MIFTHTLDLVVVGPATGTHFTGTMVLLLVVDLVLPLYYCCTVPLAPKSNMHAKNNWNSYRMIYIRNNWNHAKLIKCIAKLYVLPKF